MNKLLPTIFLAALSVPTFSQAGTVTESATQTFELWYTEGLYLNNLTNGSANPAHVRNIPVGSYNSIELSYDMQDGAFKPIDGAMHKRAADADIYGTKKLERTFFEGSLKYSNHKLDDMRWNATVLTSEQNPFLIADTLRYDSLTNDAEREQFILKGSVAYQLGERITLGLGAVYNVASKADQSDPRLIANAARTAVMPGMDFSFGSRFSAGLSGNYEIYHENIKSTVQDNQIGEHNNVYIFKALGVYEGKDAIGYKRRYDGNRIGASLQTTYNGKRMGNFTQISFESISEDAEDGETEYQYKGGDFKQISAGLSSRFLIAGDRFVHNVTLKAGMDNGSGTWYTQRQILDEWRMMNYTVVSKDVIHKQKDLNAGLTYRMDAMKDGISSFSVAADALYGKHDINQYPDENQAHYSTLHAGLSLTKRFNSGRLKYEAMASGGTDMAIGELDMTVAASNVAKQRFYNRYILPKYSYLASDSYNAALGASVCCPLNSKGMDSALKLSALVSYSKCKSDYAGLDATDRTSAAVTVSYAF